ncbi:MAG: hypothetical protein GY765_26010 [bacterium]|nr:hypothetical protein [bacterium]
MSTAVKSAKEKLPETTTPKGASDKKRDMPGTTGLSGMVKRVSKTTPSGMKHTTMQDITVSPGKEVLILPIPGEKLEKKKKQANIRRPGTTNTAA